MKIEETENGDLDFNSENYDTLKRGVVIFPETLSDAEKIDKLIEHLRKKFEK